MRKVRTDTVRVSGRGGKQAVTMDSLGVCLIRVGEDPL
jgi:hypothetical protein